MTNEGTTRFLPVKKIVYPTDFSEPALQALAVAGEVAEAAKAELILVHVVAPVPALDAPSGAPAFDLASYQDELVHSAQRALDERRRLRVPASVQARTIVSIGDAAHQVTRIAREEDADLIIIATHGRTGWRERIFGQVAERVVRLAHCPVLTIPCAPVAPATRPAPEDSTRA